MALETQDDYQDKIDDLLKEVEDLYDEGTDKGFKLKREEEMDQEVRALETEKDYQREYDRIYNEAESAGKKLEEEWVKKNKECNDLHKEMQTAIAKYQSAKKEANQIEEKLEASDQKYIKMIDKVVAEAKKKGFKIKESHISRGFTIDFESRKNSIIANLTDIEARKQDVLAGLEARALETEKDYQRELDRVEDEATKIELQIMDKHDEIDKLKTEINKLNNKQEPLLDKANKLVAEAKKKGFKIKGKIF